jgi:hypothetical protein
LGELDRLAAMAVWVSFGVAAMAVWAGLLLHRRRRGEGLGRGERQGKVGREGGGARTRPEATSREAAAPPCVRWESEKNDCVLWPVGIVRAVTTNLIPSTSTVLGQKPAQITSFC